MPVQQDADDRPVETRRLSDLKPGEAAVVERLEVTGEQRWRLMDLGLLPGTRVVAELRGPLGDPTAYRVRGALIALRHEQANLIHIRPQNGHMPEEKAST